MELCLLENRFEKLPPFFPIHVNVYVCGKQHMCVSVFTQVTQHTCFKKIEREIESFELIFSFDFKQPLINHTSIQINQIPKIEYSFYVVFKRMCIQNYFHSIYLMNQLAHSTWFRKSPNENVYIEIQNIYIHQTKFNSYQSGIPDVIAHIHTAGNFILL